VIAAWLAGLIGCQPTPLAVDPERWTPPADPLNVLLISVDTLRRDALGRYGGAGDMPWLDGWLSRGLTLDSHASCSSWTVPSMACALSGMDTLDLGFAPVGGEDSLALEAQTLADRFRATGYATALVTANTYLADPAGLGRGYQVWTEVGNAKAEQVVDLGLTEARVLAAMRSPWLLHLHFMDPHIPYQEPITDEALLASLPAIDVDLADAAQARGLENRWATLSASERTDYLRWTAALYGAQNRYLDGELERLMATLEGEGLLEDTVVVFLTDHGEQFNEHDSIFHGKSLYAEEVASVASFHGPGVSPGGVEAPTTHADILPTLLDLTGWRLTDDLTGAAVTDGTNSTDERSIFAARVYEAGAIQSVRRGGWELIYRWDGGAELFAADDAGQQADRLAEEPAVAAALWDQLAPQVERLDALRAGDGPLPPEL